MKLINYFKYLTNTFLITYTFFNFNCAHNQINSSDLKERINTAYSSHQIIKGDSALTREEFDDYINLLIKNKENNIREILDLLDDIAIKKLLMIEKKEKLDSTLVHKLSNN